TLRRAKDRCSTPGEDAVQVPPDEDSTVRSHHQTVVSFFRSGLLMSARRQLQEAIEAHLPERMTGERRYTVAPSSRSRAVRRVCLREAAGWRDDFGMFPRVDRHQIRSINGGQAMARPGDCAGRYMDMDWAKRELRGFHLRISPGSICVS